MAESPSLPELPPHVSDDVLELSRDLDRMREDVENMAVQLTWMAYDAVALRTSPELADAMQRLDEAHQRCRAAVCGDRVEEPNMDTCRDTTAATQTDPETE